MARKAMLIDESQCTACRGCQVACKQWNDLEGWSYSKTVNHGSYENPMHLSPQTWTRIKFTEHEDADTFRWLFLKEGCMHCGDPACVAVCPTKALKQKPDGRVTLEPALCNGCGYCSQFCPFNVPQLETYGFFSGEAKSSKCTFCQDRTDNGLLPACVKTCPAKALFWGDRDEMIANGKKRVDMFSKRIILARVNSNFKCTNRFLYTSLRRVCKIPDVCVGDHSIPAQWCADPST